MPNCATRSGNRLFFTPNQLSSDQTLPVSLAGRTAALQLISAYLDVDTVLCELPAGLSVEHAFEPIQFNARFGSYQAMVKVEGNTVKYIRKLEIKSGQYEPAVYAEYVDFRRKIAKADRAQILLK